MLTLLRAGTLALLIAAAAQTAAATPAADRKATSYVVGLDVAGSIRQIAPDLDLAAFERAVVATLAGNAPVLPDAERQKWIASLPHLSAEWVKNNEARGVQAKPLLTQYMAAVKARGAKPERDWEK